MGFILRRLRAALSNGLAARPAKADGVKIRAMAYPDLSAVAAIERTSFSNPWRLNSYAHAVTTPNHHFFVAEIEGELVAYAGFWVEGCGAHIAKLAVHPALRRRGIASTLLRHVLDQVRLLGLPHAHLEVRRSNLTAQALYRRFGFRFERIQPKAYPDNDEDALVFARDGLLETTGAQAPGTPPSPTERGWG